LAIESLPFQALAGDVEKALLQVADAIGVLDPDLVRKPIHEFFDTIESKIKEVPLADVQAAVGAVWNEVKSVLQQIDTQLTGVKDTLTALTSRVNDLTQQLKPILDTVSKDIDTIKAMLDSFDLKEPASLIVDDLHQLRDKLAAVDFSVIPGPALSGLHAGAQLLRGLDVAGAVNPPLGDALAKVDPTPQLQSVTVSLSGATVNLRAVGPVLRRRAARQAGRRPAEGAERIRPRKAQPPSARGHSASRGRAAST
jgi:ABC-type transporter Mla subunit MlaD